MLGKKDWTRGTVDGEDGGAKAVNVSVRLELDEQELSHEVTAPMPSSRRNTVLYLRCHLSPFLWIVVSNFTCRSYSTTREPSWRDLTVGERSLGVQVFLNNVLPSLVSPFLPRR